jgi:hypothetical protein
VSLQWTNRSIVARTNCRMMMMRPAAAYSTCITTRVANRVADPRNTKQRREEEKVLNFFFLFFEIKLFVFFLLTLLRPDTRDKIKHRSDEANCAL